MPANRELCGQRGCARRPDAKQSRSANVPSTKDELNKSEALVGRCEPLVMNASDECKAAGAMARE
jgi:hypothetical protein